VAEKITTGSGVTIVVFPLKSISIFYKVFNVNYSISFFSPQYSVEFGQCTHQTSKINNIGACQNIGEEALANRRYRFGKKW